MSGGADVGYEAKGVKWLQFYIVNYKFTDTLFLQVNYLLLYILCYTMIKELSKVYKKGDYSIRIHES